MSLIHTARFDDLGLGARLGFAVNKMLTATSALPQRCGLTL